MTDENLDAILSFDAINTAEKLLGKDAPYNDVTALGMVFMLGASRRKDAILKERKDSYYGMTVDDYIDLLISMGLEKVFELSFYGDGQGTEEKFYVFASKREGLICKFDTYQTLHVNSSSIYYNWVPNGDDCWGVTSSGSMRDGVWSGDHDGREAIAYKMQRLREHGIFQPRWSRAPFLWFLHYGDTKVENYDYKSINAERMAAMPGWVQEIIGTSE